MTYKRQPSGNASFVKDKLRSDDEEVKAQGKRMPGKENKLPKNRNQSRADSIDYSNLDWEKLLNYSKKIQF